MLNSLSTKSSIPQLQALQSLQLEETAEVSDVKQSLITQNHERCSQNLEESFVLFLNEKDFSDKTYLQFEEIQQTLVEEFYEFAKESLAPNSLVPDAFSEQAIRECFLLFRGVFQGILNNSKMFSKPLKTNSDVRVQLNREKKFLSDSSKLQTNPFITSEAKKIAMANLIQKGLIIERSSQLGSYYSFTILATPFIKLFSELLMVRGMICDSFKLTFGKDCYHHLLIDFYLKQAGFDIQTFNFEINTELYLEFFGVGFISFFNETKLLEIYNQFVEHQQTVRDEQIEAEKALLLAERILQEKRDFEKKLSKELSLERKNVSKLAENSLKLEFQTFSHEMFRIFESEFLERKELSLNREYLDFLKSQAQTFSEMSKERKLLFFKDELKQQKLLIGAHSQELINRSEISQQRLLELINTKRQEKKQKETILKTSSIFSRKMMYNLISELPKASSILMKLKSLQSEVDYEKEKLLQAENDLRNLILFNSQLERLENEESKLRKKLENETQYTLLRAHNPYGAPKLKCLSSNA